MMIELVAESAWMMPGVEALACAGAAAGGYPGAVAPSGVVAGRGCPAAEDSPV